MTIRVIKTSALHSPLMETASRTSEAIDRNIQKKDLTLLAQEVEAIKLFRSLYHNPFIFEAAWTVDTKIMVRLDNDHCSVPAGLVGEEVEVYTNSTPVRIYHGKVQAAEHLLVPKDEQNPDRRYRVDYRHYKGVLPKKAGSLLNSRLITTNPDLRDLYMNNFNVNSKLFIRFLEEMNPMPQEQLRWAAESFLKQHSSTLKQEMSRKAKKGYTKTL